MRPARRAARHDLRNYPREFLSKSTNLMTRILLAASLVVVASLGGFSTYINGLQHRITMDTVERNLRATGTGRRRAFRIGSTVAYCSPTHLPPRLRMRPMRR